MALSRNTKPEFILLAAIGGVSTILGPKTKIIIRKSSNKETVLHKKKGYEELPGIFLTILSEPGAGKTTAFNVAIQDPLLEQNDSVLNSLLIQVSILIKAYLFICYLTFLHQKHAIINKVFNFNSMHAIPFFC